MPTALPARLVCSFLIASVAAALIVLRIWSSENGFISPDSTQYLAAAESLISDRGLNIANDGRGALADTRFAIWPAGYPAAIATVSNVSGLSVFAASKVLNVGLLFATVLLISAGFGRTGFALSLVPVFGAYLEIFSFTWSEGAFQFLLVIACLLASKAIERPMGGADVRIIGLGLAVVALFLCRYVGAFAIVIPALLCVLDIIAKRYARAGLGALASLACLIFFGVYLYTNQQLTGHVTGIARVPAPESSSELINQLAIAFVRELILPLPNWHPGNPMHLAIFAAQAAALLLFAYVAFRHRKHCTKSHIRDPLTWLLLLVGAAYLGVIILLRWRTAFDGFGFRLLAPGSLLIILGIFRTALFINPRLQTACTLFMVSMATLSLAQLALTSDIDPNRFASETEARRARYAAVPEGAILVFGGLHVRYLRPDLHLAAPIPFSATGLPEDREPWQSFLNDLDPDAPVYVEIGESPDWTEPFHPSVASELAAFPAGQVFLLR